MFVIKVEMAKNPNNQMIKLVHPLGRITRILLNNHLKVLKVYRMKLWKDTKVTATINKHTTMILVGKKVTTDHKI